MAKKKTLKNTYKVTKHNALNEMRANNMTMQELRLFSVYLSRINPQNSETRHVKFSIAEFQAIMELGRMNIAYYKKVAESLLGKVISLTTKYGGFDAFTLFSRFRLDSDDNGEWFVDIIANDEAMPLLFEFKGNYFKYELWNALHLKGPNQLRLYEILKQYEKASHRIVSVADLRHWLGIEDNEYPVYANFRRAVLEPCREAIAEHTDIIFTYEPHKKGAKGKILELKFNIQKNTSHQDPLTLRKFVELNSDNVIDAEQINLNDVDSDDTEELLDAGLITKIEDKLIFLRDAVKKEFTIEQMAILYDIVVRDLPHLATGDWIKLYHHVMEKYNYMKEKDNKGEIRNPFGYLKRIIGEFQLFN
jgi:plasmid replication initiation protein